MSTDAGNFGVTIFLILLLSYHVVAAVTFLWNKAKQKANEKKAKKR